jgi:NADH-quinone oxidoreductase subunit G
MPKFKLDNREIDFSPGETIIQAARRAGIDIPHYCWHPGLSVAANCRMCLVELSPPPGRKPLLLDVLQWDKAQQAYVPDKKPKLVPACQQTVGEGMEVLSESSGHVTQARSAVQEMLLLNHPVDCPICDQAGECRLQDYWLEHGATAKRMHDEPIHKPKGVQFGPTIVYDAERCILCTRCIRVCDEVAKDPVLSIRERGNLGEITVTPGRMLDHPYTLMTEYVCPVGALTAVDFRFKARVWFLRSAPTVCTGCATGCNAFTDFDPRNQTVYRYRPRENPNVNKYWMCDDGMLDYRRVHAGRVLAPRVKGEPTTRQAALEKAVKALSGVDGAKLALVLSAQHSNEDNFALLALGRDRLGAKRLYLSARPDGQGDSVLRHTDKNPNTQGVKKLAVGTPLSPLTDLAKAVEAGEVTHVLALGSVAPDGVEEALKKLKALVTLATHTGPLAARARVLLPASSWAESSGTFVNAKGVAQSSAQAISPQGESRPAWKLCAELAKALGSEELAWSRVEHVQRAMAPEKPASATVGATP